jgi:uncharacterized membrane protein
MRDGDFRVRGKDISRVEGLSDAVFGFAITLLAISLEVPRTSGEVLHALRGAVPFAVTFLMLFSMWRTQFMFFRRYGIEDKKIVWLTGALLFVLLVFIYPLKFITGVMYESLLARIGLGLPDFHRAIPFPERDIAPLFAVYGFGFATVFGVFSLMYRHAYSLRESLHLNDVEVFDTFEVIRSTTKVCLLGLALGVTYLIAAVFPAYAVTVQNVGAVLVIAAVFFVFRQRRSHKKRRQAIRQQSAIGGEA